MLDIHITHVLTVTAIIWLLMVILNKLFYRPVGAIIEQRETKIANETAQIEALTEEIRSKTLHIETVLKDAKKESSHIKESLIRKGEVVREEMLARAREDSQVMFSTKMKELDLELQSAEKQLEQEIASFSAKIKELFV